MPVLYEPFQSVFKNKDDKKLYHPRVVYVGSVNTERIAREVAAYSSLTSGDVKNTIDNLVTVMTQHLQASETMTLDGFGSFRILMKSQGKGVEKEEDVSASQAMLHVRFMSAATRNPDRSIATRSLVTGVKCQRFDRTTVDSIGGEVVPDPTPDEGGGEEEAPDPRG